MKKSYSLRLVKEIKDRKNEVYVITGFQGFGAVGFIASKYLVSKLNMELVGYIDTPRIPDFTSIEDYGFSMPHEIFYKDIDDQRRIFTLLNRINPDKKYITSFVNEVISFIKNVNGREVILFGGLDTRFREGNEEYRWLKTNTCSRVLNAPYFIKGAYVVGPLASLLIALQQHNISALVILPYTQPDVIDHKAAAIAIKTLSLIINIEIDVDELLKYVEKVEEIEKMIYEVYEQQLKKRESVMHT